MRTPKGIAIAVLMVFLMISCRKDKFDFDKVKSPTWEPELAVPLFYASLSVQDLLDREDNDSIVQVGEDKFCTIVYSGDLLSFTAGDVLNIPDQQHQEEYSLTQAQIDFFVQNQNAEVGFPMEVPFVFERNVELDSIKMKSGRLLLRVTSELKHNADVSISFNNISLGNNPLKVTCRLQYNQSLPLICENEYDLTNAVFNLDELLTPGKLDAVVNLKLENLGNEAGVDDKVKVELFLTDLQFSEAYGYIGNYEFNSVADNIYLQIFKNSAGLGHFSLVEPELELVARNSFGLPIGLQFLEIKALTVNGNWHNINGPGISNPLLINSPLLSEAGQSVETRIVYDKDNSNVFDVVERYPREIFYRIKAIANPQGKSKNNFLFDTSRIELGVNVRLPLYGNAQDFVLYDTLNFEFSNVEEVNKAGFRSRIVNGFPIGFEIQIYFANGDGKIIDSLFNSESFAPAAITEISTGIVSAPTTQLTDVEFDKERLEQLPETRMVIIKATASTANGSEQDVKIYSDYTFDVALSASAEIKVKL